MFQSQLATLRKALHKLLDNPIRLAEKGGWREVTLFESIIYRIYSFRAISVIKVAYCVVIPSLG